MNKNTGISAIGLSIPPIAMSLKELAKLHRTDANKYLIGLGCNEMSICPKNFGVIELAEIAAKRALENWNGSAKDIGMVVVGTESGVDMSRPIASWVMEKLNLKGPIRSYEVKHACFGGTLAIRQAVEWKLSGNDNNRAALVIAADQGLYAFKHPGEPTQGSGATAFIIDNNATIANINTKSYAWSSPEYDFWRPIGEPFPNVNGRLSMECYKTAVIECFKQLMQEQNNFDLNAILNNYEYLCFHVPFPKMVKKAFIHLCEKNNLKQDKIIDLFDKKVQPILEWNTKIGNCYTASLWFSVAKALTELKKDKEILSFSYGSGFGAELLSIKSNHTNINPYWKKQFEADLSNREFISCEEYLRLRDRESSPASPESSPSALRADTSPLKKERI